MEEHCSKCSCGFSFPYDSDFQYCPNCGEERIIAAPEAKGVSRDSLTVSTLKTILENAKKPIQFDIVSLVDDQFDAASPEAANTILVKIKDPETGTPVAIGDQVFLSVSVAQVKPDSSETDQLYSWCGISVRGLAKLKPMGLFSSWDVDGTVQRLTDRSLLASFQLNTEGAERFIIGFYLFPLFFRTTEDDILHTVGLASMDILSGFESIVDKLHHPWEN